MLKIYSLLAALGLCFGERGQFFVAVCRLLILLLQSTGSRGWIQKLWQTGLVAPRQVGSSWTRDQTRVPCTGRWIPIHCDTREAPRALILDKGVYMTQDSQELISVKAG